VRTRQRERHDIFRYSQSQTTLLPRCYGLRLNRSSIEISENGADIAQIMLTCFRQAHASMAAFEQSEADLVFENADASTDCRLLQVQRNGGLTETAFLGGSEYIAQMFAERLWTQRASSCCASAIATTSIVTSRRSLPLPTEVDDLGCQADDENDEKAGLRPEEEW
jgi:hypothetical protein